MHLTDLLSDIPYEATHDISRIEIANIAHIYADITPNTLFVCLRGMHRDSHALLPTLHAAGAVCAVVERGAYTALPPDLPCVTVSDARYALARLWSRFCGAPEEALQIVGITGTNGKTSTATLLYRIFRTNGRRVGLISTVAALLDGETYVPPRDTGGRMATMTTPDPDLLYPYLQEARRRGIETVIMEVSSHALALGKVAPIRFTEAIFTSFGADHLDFHKTLDAYGAEKEKLFHMCEHATVCIDDPFGAALAQRIPCPTTTCGSTQGAEAHARAVEEPCDVPNPFLYTYGDIRYLVHLRLAGDFSRANALLAITSAIHLGLPPCAVFRAVEAVTSIAGRMETVSGENDDIRVIIDYAHTESALRSLLAAARTLLPPPRRVLLVFGCGGDRDREKRPAMGRAAMEMADHTFITSDNPRYEEPAAIIKDILLGHTSPEKRRVIPSRKRAIETAILTAEAGDLVLLVGKGHERYEIVKGEARPFDERAIAVEALAERRLTAARGEDHAN